MSDPGPSAVSGLQDPEDAVVEVSGGGPARPPVYRQRQLGVLVVVLGAMCLLPLRYDGDLDLRIMGEWLTLSTLGVSFWLVFGLGGVFAFSHPAFYAVGAYTSVWAAEGRSPWLGLLAATVVCALVAAAFMLIGRRTTHFAFGIATLAFSFLSVVVLTNWESFTAPGGEVVSGIEAPSLFGATLDTPFRQYWLMLGALAVVLLLVVLIERSPVRREALAARDNPVLATAWGVPVGRLKFTTFVIGSAMAGAAGSLFAHRVRSVTPDSFPVELGLDIFVIVLLGGIGSMWGALLGAAYVTWFPEYTESLEEYQGVINGALLVAIIIFLPAGLIGIGHTARRWWPSVRRWLGRWGPRGRASGARGS